jgi:internalin A
MTNIDHISELIEMNKRRLQILEKQQATMGVATPPHIVIEIEDINEKISQLKAQLDNTKNIKLEAKQSTKIEDKKTNTRNDRAIFVSYAWGGESEKLVNEIDQAFQKRGIIIVRDKRDLGFKGRIKEFMQQLGLGKAIVVIIGKRYLESENCMFELLEIAANGDFYDRIFPIVLSDANIYRQTARLEYIQYWENKIQILDESIKSVASTANLQGFRDSIDLYTKIREMFARLIDTISDMNTLTPEIHLKSEFSTLLQSIEQKIDE